MQLQLGERVQPDRLEASGQRVRDRRHRQHPRRAGEHEAPRGAPSIDFQLQGGEEPRHALHLVEDDALREVGDEAQRIGLGAGADDVRCRS